jgi:hypothetical protein
MQLQDLQQRNTSYNQVFKEIEARTQTYCLIYLDLYKSQGFWIFYNLKKSKHTLGILSRNSSRILFYYQISP